MSSEEAEVGSNKLRKTGLAIAGIFGGVGFGLIAVAVPFVLPALRKYCLPYVPATPVQTQTILRHIRGRPGKVVDLGSGDGRVVRLSMKCFIWYSG